MDKKFSRIRRLNHIEEAFTLTNQAFPLRVVIALHVTPSPTYNDLSFAVTEVRRKHLLLQSAIKRINGDLAFIKLNPDHSISVTEHHGDLDWKQIVEHLLNLRFPESGPLLQIDLIKERDNNRGVIIVSFHHAIIDGNSARLILDELLTALSKRKEKVKDPAPALPESIPILPENLFPNLLKFIGGELREEWIYRTQGFAAKPAIHSENNILHLRFTKSFTLALKSACLKNRINLNNLIIAALTLATLKYKHPHKNSGLVRIINFVNVGLSIKPRINVKDLGCYISMLRLSVPLSANDDVIALATKIKRLLVSMGRTDRIKLMAWLSKYLVRMTLKSKNMRMGVSALSFIGTLDLATNYGSYELLDVNAFISNNRYGPQFSAFGKVLHDRLGLDLNYLTAETSQDQALRIVEDLKLILSQVAGIA